LDRPRGKYWETWMQFLTERLLKFGFISEEDFAFFKIKHGAQDAAAEVTQFYKVLSLGALGGGALRHPP
jgi:predicted Rossmann-fold nucleotide-binding protein